MTQGSWVNESMLVLRIIAAALFMSLVIYAVVGFVFVSAGSFKPPSGGNTLMKLVLACAGLFTAALSFFMRAMILSEKNIMGADKSKVQPLDPSIDPVHLAIFQIFFTGNIVGLVLSEAIGIYGLVIMFVIGDSTYFIGLLFFSAVIMAFHFPRAEKLKELIKSYDMKKSMSMTGPVT